MDLDDIWLYLGDFGRYQTLAYILISLIGTWLPAWQIFGIIFTSDEPPFHCRASSGLSPEESAPIAANETNWQCLMYQVLGVENGTTVVNTSQVVDCTNGYEFQPLNGETTIVMELDLVCDQKILASTAQSILYFGVLVGAFVFGQLSDLIGRKTVLLLSVFLQALTGIAIYFVYEYHWFVTIWFFTGMFEQGMNLAEYVLIMEMFSPKKRAIAGCINNISWGIGVTLLAPIAYLLGDWRKMQLAISLPCLVAIPLWFVLYESVRWLLSRGKYEKSFRILNRIARFNSISPPPDGFVITYEGRTIRESSLQHDVTSHSNGKVAAGDTQASSGEDAPITKTYTFIDLLRSWRLFRNLLIMSYSWFVNSMVYYGLSLYSSNLAGDKYFNFFLLGLVEIPAYIISSFTMIWWGRRPSLFLFHLLAGVACVVTACLPRDTDGDETFVVPIVVAAVLGKFFITCSFGVAFLYGIEIFPTPVRNIGFGISSFCGRVGSILAPFIVYLDDVSPYIPLNIFGGFSLLAAALVLILPETRNKPLPETIQDAEELGRTPPLSRDRSRRGGPGLEAEEAQPSTKNGIVNPAVQEQDSWL